MQEREHVLARREAARNCELHQFDDVRIEAVARCGGLGIIGGGHLKHSLTAGVEVVLDVRVSPETTDYLANAIAPLLSPGAAFAFALGSTVVGESASRTSET